MKLNNKRKVTALLIDLDDTLYLEHTYVLSGIEAVVDFICREYLTLSRRDVLIKDLQYNFLKFGRKQLFNSIVEEAKGLQMQEIVTIYRQHTPKISLMSGIEEVLNKLSTRFQLALVTDGNSIMQKNKIKALGIESHFNVIVCCDQLAAAKPDPRAFLEAANQLKVDIEDCVIIGDDPFCDIAAADKLGVSSIRVMTGRYQLMSSRDANSLFVNHFTEVLSHPLLV